MLEKKEREKMHLIFPLLDWIRGVAVILFATILLVDAAALDTFDRSNELHQQQQEHTGATSRSVSAALFGELQEAARLADIAYCVGTTGIHDPFECLSHCKEFQGFELITTWNTGPLLSDSCGYVALSHAPFAKRIIVAFRGTYSLTNTIIDLSAVPQTYVPYPADGEDGSADKTGNTNPLQPENQPCLNCTVHAGFWTSWKNTRDTVLSAVTQAREHHPEYEVTLIGHSLGGAVAALASLEMHARGLNPRVTTFGEPKVGNERMAEFINDMFGLSSSSASLSSLTESNEHGSSSDDDDTKIRYRRVTHRNDPVPLLPLTEWGYTPHAGEIFISKLDLPASRADLEHCSGNTDTRCISGSENVKEKDVTKLPFLLAHEQLRSFSHPEQTSSGADLLDSTYDRQTALTDGTNAQIGDPRAQARWSLVPSRYQIWELFFSHRDYFLRIGLCIPGGDRTTWRWL